jgi:predicted transcriptional regulator of viral defense system
VTYGANRSPRASLRSSRPRSTQAERLLDMLETRALVRARELAKIGVDRKTLSRLDKQGTKVEKRSRGLYAIAGSQNARHARLAEACKRVPGGAICLFSALYFHDLITEEPPEVWMAIDRKARRPCAASLRLKFVRFSGLALSQGVINLNLGGVPVRVYSPMKSIADCFKYRNIGLEVGVAALAAAVEQNLYNRQKLLRFADICRVRKIVVLEADKVETRAREATQASTSAVVSWDRQSLEQEVWAEPLKQLARRYGVSDVALAKRCRKLGIALPGRGYWAKKLRLDPTHVRCSRTRNGVRRVSGLVHIGLPLRNKSLSECAGCLGSQYEFRFCGSSK